jgi:hypothetical protein
MKSTLTLLTLAGFLFSSASAADKVPQPNPQIQIAKSDSLGSAFMLDHVVSYGSLSMALPQKPDSLEASKSILSKIAAGPNWKIVRGTPSASLSGYLSLFRATSDQMTPALIQLSSQTIGGLDLKQGSEVAFILEKDSLYLTTSRGDKHLILTSKDIKTAHQMTNGASGLAATGQ